MKGRLTQPQLIVSPGGPKREVAAESPADIFPTFALLRVHVVNQLAELEQVGFGASGQCLRLIFVVRNHQ